MLTKLLRKFHPRVPWKSLYEVRSTMRTLFTSLLSPTVLLDSLRDWKRRTSLPTACVQKFVSSVIVNFSILIDCWEFATLSAQIESSFLSVTCWHYHSHFFVKDTMQSSGTQGWLHRLRWNLQNTYLSKSPPLQPLTMDSWAAKVEMLQSERR